MVELREKFSILKGCQTVTRALRTRRSFRRYRFQLDVAPVAPLLRERKTEANSFFIVGVDFSELPCVRTRPPLNTKAYVPIFSWAITRAINFEIPSDITAPVWLLECHRFVPRRGVPVVIYSDQAHTFRCCAHPFRTSTIPDVGDVRTHRRILCKFMPERVPWWGNGGI